MIEVTLERVAHGGYVVGRVKNKVVFVTDGLPGERVLVEITETGARFDRARVVEVLEPSDGRVAAPCPIADACGGCDWQHASPATQRQLKTEVVREQLARLAGVSWDGHVEPVDPLRGWRTRMRYVVADGHVGLRARRSHDVVALPDQGCLAAVPGPSPAQLDRLAEGARELTVVHSVNGMSVFADDQLVSGPKMVRERAGGHEFRVAARGFWQVHPAAGDVLQAAVIQGLRPLPGDVALDLYCGAGLFAAALVHAGAEVTGVELVAAAVANARHNVPQGRFLAMPLAKALRRLPPKVDLVVLDPPRRGAGAAVVAKIADMAPRGIAYVACDPASLARDLAWFEPLGYGPESIRAFDLFPMTHHVECVAVLKPRP
ncbi:MAG: TRAM domain-containing protein [Propionibacteriaceae bacterium]|nr:TRAM domain-containing protein [Propionibacteriaceae bacterium]